MQRPLDILPGALYELFAQVSATGKVTIADRYGLLAAVLDTSLTEEEQMMINRILRAAIRGKLEFVDDLSTLS